MRDIFINFLESLKTPQNNTLIDTITEGFISCIESIHIDNNTYLRGEPIEAMQTSLTLGVLPSSKRDTTIKPENITHRPDRVSIGKGNKSMNPAFMTEFFGDGKLIYVIDSNIQHTKGFKSNSDHPQSTEYLAKRVSPFLITGIIVNDIDESSVKSKLNSIINSTTDDKLKAHLQTINIIKESDI
jgi:hypothetical protein